ncbi:MAG: tetratricopeptide repeat protein, partial [Victivallaceae bacterium]
MPDIQTVSHLGLYRSGITGSEHRRHITVGRKALLQDTLEILRKNCGRKPKHHQLFIGPRGIGKTHLLSLIEDEITQDSELSGAYHVARFPEESHRTLSFADFLLGLCEILRDTLPDEPVWKKLSEELATQNDDSRIVDKLVPAIRKRWRERRQAILVMMENINQVFEAQIKDSRSIAALRGFLMEDNGCLLMATAPLQFDAITDHKAPFYDFFDFQVLDQLSDEETIELIRLNLEWEKRSDLLAGFADMRPRLLALYRMTGGSPRLSLMLYELIAGEAVTAVRRQFEILLDRITPFYQDRMRDLGPQERAILETIALLRDQPKTPAMIAARMRMNPGQVSALLGRLVKAQYLRTHENPADKRSRLYTIREGFFDIWLAMNNSRGARVRLPFLVDFFANFYPTIEQRNRKREELKQKFTTQEDATHVPDIREALDYLSDVGAPEERATEKLRLVALHATQGDASRSAQYAQEALLLPLDPMGKWIADHAGNETAPDYLGEVEKMIVCWEAHRTGGLEALAQKLHDLGEELTLKSWSEFRIDFLREHLKLLPVNAEQIEIRLQLAYFLLNLARWQDAEQEFRMALDNARALENDDLTSRTMNGLARLLMSTARYAEAEPLFRESLVIDERTHGDNHPRVAIRLNNLARLLQDTNRLTEAEPLMRRALKINEQNCGTDHPMVATILNNLAQLLQDSNRLADAEPLMRRALEIDEHSYGKDHPTVAIRLNNLALLLQVTNRLSDAEPLMKRELEIDERSYGKDHPTVARDLNNLASLLKDANHLAEAEPLMKRA